MALTALLAIAIGVVLVTLGAGGSIVTVPVLVYAAGLDPTEAVATSLVVVGAVAVVGVLVRRRSVALRTGLVVGAAGMLGTVPGVWLNHRVPGFVVLLGFAATLLVAAFMMARESGPGCPPRASRWPTLAAGLGVGVATGFFGVGGGFLVVPVLSLLLGLGMREAVATSLLVVVLNSGAALLGHLAYGSIDWVLGGAVTLAALAGALVGLPLASRVSPLALRRGFAVVCVMIAIGMATESLWTLVA